MFFLKIGKERHIQNGKELTPNSGENTLCSGYIKLPGYNCPKLIEYKVSARAERTTEGEELVWFGTLAAMKVC